MCASKKKPRLITLPQTRVSPSNPFPQPIAHGTKGKPLSDEESMKVDRLLLKEMLKSWYALVTEPGPARRSSVHLQEVEAKKEEHQSLAKLLEEEREKNKALQKELIAKEEE
ncbi:unnamed protein product, partial [Effrenium voratum]